MVSTVILLLFIAFFVSCVTSYRRLRTFKGPLWATLTESWLAYKTFVGGLNLELARINQEYGKWLELSS
jgi:hypothetical protein